MRPLLSPAQLWIVLRGLSVNPHTGGSVPLACAWLSKLRASGSHAATVSRAGQERNHASSQPGACRGARSSQLLAGVPGGRECRPTTLHRQVHARAVRARGAFGVPGYESAGARELRPLVADVGLSAGWCGSEHGGSPVVGSSALSVGSEAAPDEHGCRQLVLRRRSDCVRRACCLRVRDLRVGRRPVLGVRDARRVLPAGVRGRSSGRSRTVRGWPGVRPGGEYGGCRWCHGLRRVCRVVAADRVRGGVG